MYASKLSKEHQARSEQLVQSTHIIYTPTIIKFRYPAACKRVDEQSYLNTLINQQTIKCQHIQLKISKNSAKNEPTKTSQRKGKVQVTTAKKQFYPLKPTNKPKKAQLAHSGIQISQGKQSEPLFKLPENKDHITSTPFIQNFSCDFFSECNEPSSIDEGQRKPLSFDDSRKTIQMQRKVNAQLDTHNKLLQRAQEHKPAMYGFKRKNIFDQNNLNRTFDVAYAAHARSRSRRSIFQQTANLCDLSFSKNRSSSKRKRIFEQLGSQKSKTTLQSYQQSIQQSQIPTTILQGWQKFSACSEEDHQDNLPTVKEMKLQQSQVQFKD